MMGPVRNGVGRFLVDQRVHGGALITDENCRLLFVLWSYPSWEPLTGNSNWAGPSLQ